MSDKKQKYVPADKALEKLRSGNKKYVASGRSTGKVSKAIRVSTCHEGQHPYAVVLTCSDSRVIPEVIFQAGIGDLFVIRVAGNVIDDHQLGSIEYAIDHLGSRLIVVLGHENCGAVHAALSGGDGGYIKSITDEIRAAIGDEKDETKASVMNARYISKMIDDKISGMSKSAKDGVVVAGAFYRLESGEVEFL